MKIAIIGAGIGGLTTALLLERAGLSAHVYEQAKNIQPVGAGIILAHNAMQVFQKLDLQYTIAELGKPLSSLNICTPDLSIISKIDTSEFDQQYAVQNIAIQRGKLQKVLIKSLQSSVLSLNKKLININNNTTPLLEFSDGTTLTYDVVIGADGINSVTRNSLFPNSSLRYAQQRCWRGIANFSLPENFQHELNEAWGHGNRFGFVQISPNQVYWYALSNLSTPPISQNPVDLFYEYHPIVNQILTHTNSTKILLNEIQDLKPIKNWFKGRTCLLGDAAHATTPNMGQGACQAIEDAYVLSHCLANYLTEDALQKYQNLRMPKAKSIVKMSWNLGKVAHIQNPLLAKLRNFAMKVTPSSLQNRQSSKIFELAQL